MASIVESIQKRSFLSAMPRNLSLPVSQRDPSKDPQQEQSGLRRRLSSLSLKIQPISSSSTPWVFTRSKSLSSMGHHAGSSIRKWWDWGWDWILSRNPSFSTDLEMHEDAKNMPGSQNKSSWSYIFYRVRVEFRKLLRSDNSVVLPRTFR